VRPKYPNCKLNESKARFALHLITSESPKLLDPSAASMGVVKEREREQGEAEQGEEAVLHHGESASCCASQQKEKHCCQSDGKSEAQQEQQQAQNQSLGRENAEKTCAKSCCDAAEEGDGDEDCCSESSFCEDTFAVEALCCDSRAVSVAEDMKVRNGVILVESDSGSHRVRVSHGPGISCSAIAEVLRAQKLYPKSVVPRPSTSVEAPLKDPLVKESTIFIAGLCCSSEIPAIHKVLDHLDGVVTVQADLTFKQIRVLHDPSKTSCTDIVRVLNGLNLGPKIIRDGSCSEDEVKVDIKQRGTKKTKRCFGPSWNVKVALVLWLISLFHYVPDPDWMFQLRFVALGAIALTLPAIAVKAVANVRQCSLNVNVLMCLAVIGAVVLGEFSEGAAVVTLFSMSDWLSEKASRRVRESISALVELNPERAVLAQDCVAGSRGDSVPVDNVEVGTILLVRPGDAFPLDGTLCRGQTFADESALTGESRPVEKQTGAPVSAGTLNLSEYVEIITTAGHTDSTMSKMLRLIEEANMKRSPTQQLVEKVAQRYTPLAFLTAVLLATIPFAFGKETGRQFAELALVILVVACPCALVISTPITYTCGLAASAKNGILVKSGLHLELLGRMKSICLDKTGTLTVGSFELRRFREVTSSNGSTDPSLSKDLILNLVATAEQGSSHPIAQAFSEQAKDVELERVARLLSLETLAGEGFRAELLSAPLQNHSADTDAPPKCCPKRDWEVFNLFVGNKRMAERLEWFLEPNDVTEIDEWEADGLTVGWVGIDSGPLFIFAVGDRVRPEALDVVSTLRSCFHVKPVMLTGDNHGSAAAVARELGIDQFHAELLPADKVDRIKEFEGIVGMVGDGTNDAPSLAITDVSISMNGIGTPAAIETADVVLMRDDLNGIVQAVRIGRSCYKRIIENISFSIISKLFVLVIAITLYPALWLAILVDIGGMFLVTLNSMRILKM